MSGPRGWKPATLENIAHHEAGHFVAAYFNAMHDRVDYVSIKPTDETLGIVSGQHPLGEDVSEREVRRLVVQVFAGYAADVRFDPARKDGSARNVAREDDEQAEEYLHWIAKTKRDRAKLERILRLDAAALIEEHWPAVQALARELVERKRLDVYEASWIVAIAEGEHAARELPEYRRRALALGRGAGP